MNSQIELDNIIEVISKANRIGIFTHINPDGDAIGSSMALFLGLRKINKDVEIVADEYSRCFNFLSSLDLVKKEGNGGYDLAIALDCATRGRLYDPNSSFDNSIINVVIDHHESNTFFGKFNYVEDRSPATCKTLVKVLKRLNVELDKDYRIIKDSNGNKVLAHNELLEFYATKLYKDKNLLTKTLEREQINFV